MCVCMCVSTWGGLGAWMCCSGSYEQQVLTYASVFGRILSVSRVYVCVRVSKCLCVCACSSDYRIEHHKYCACGCVGIIRKKQAVKHYPKTYENVSAYVSFHTFFWRKWRFIPLPGFSNIIWYYFIPHVDILHTFLFSYPLWQGFIPPATFIHILVLHTYTTSYSLRFSFIPGRLFTLWTLHTYLLLLHTCSSSYMFLLKFILTLHFLLLNVFIIHKHNSYQSWLISYHRQ